MLIALLCCQSLAQTPPAQQANVSSVEEIPTEVFRAAHAIYHAPPPYPSDEGLNHEEGWVILSLMVEPSGKPSDMTVTASTGNKHFENAAMRTAEETTFKPATLNGEPIESAYVMRYVFVDPYARHGISTQFLHAYKLLLAATQAKNQSAADAAMQGLKAENLNEDAYVGLAQYDYAYVWGNEAQQIAALNRALAWAKSMNTLPDETYISTLRTRLLLELKTHQYAAATTSWTQLQRDGIDRKTRAALAPIMQQVEKIRTGPGEVTDSGELANGSWSHALFKRQFRIDVHKGYISDVKLRCDKGYVYFAFDPKLQYEVHGKYGRCTMQVEGTAGTQFTLIEF